MEKNNDIWGTLFKKALETHIKIMESRKRLENELLNDEQSTFI